MKAQRSSQSDARCRQRSLVGVLREFLTPALWKQAHQARRRLRKKKSTRWLVQPLVLMVLLMTWSHGDSQAERFECAKAYCQVCLYKRRNPGKGVGGFQKALARLPMVVLRVVATGVRRMLELRLADHWLVDGFVPIGCDGSRVECPRTTELEARMGQAGKAGSAPTLWVTALVHLRWGVPWAWRFGKGTASERDHLIQLLDVLPRLALLVADAGYFGFRLAEQLVRRDVKFLLRMSSNVTLYTREQVRLERYREGEVYYWPAKKDRTAGAQPLRLRLIRIRAKHHRHDVSAAHVGWNHVSLALAKRRMFPNLQTHAEEGETCEPHGASAASRGRGLLAGAATVARPRSAGSNGATRQAGQARRHRVRMRARSEVQPDQNPDGDSHGAHQCAAAPSSQVRTTPARGPRRATPTNQRQGQPCLAAPQAAQAAKTAKTPRAVHRPKS
jgi:hypothetical protein